MKTQALAIARIFRRQHGVVAFRQLRELGFTNKQIRRRVESGVWRSPLVGVYALNGSPETWRQRCMIATLAGFPTAALSHRAGLFLWGIEPYAREKLAPRPEIMTTRWLREQHKRLRVHESKELLPTDYDVVDGIPILRPERIVADLPYFEFSDQRVKLAIDDMVRLGLCTYQEILERLVLMQPLGRRGFKVLLDYIEHCLSRPSPRPPDSGFGTIFFDWLRREGIELPEVEVTVVIDGRAFRLDAVWRQGQRSPIPVVELHGNRHKMPTRQASDAERNAALAAAGYIVLEIWWDEWVADRAGVLARVKELLDQTRR